MKFPFEKSRKIFLWTLSAAALALTGCATGRYDDSARVSPSGLATGGVRIARPLEGAIVVPFGARESGVLSKGVWIEGRPGATVAAAAEGRVAFADERMEGYGKTVILEHPGGAWTVYAHLSAILVKAGESVPAGKAIGRLDERNKRLYFELRRGDRAEDPAPSWV